MPKTISVERIKSFDLCENRWKVFRETYPDRESVTWQEIVDSNGIGDLLWVVAHELPRPALVGLLVDLVGRVEDVYNNAFPDDSRVSDCLAACRKYAAGDIGIAALRAAARHAAAAVALAARHAADAVYYAAAVADAAARAAYAARATDAAYYAAATAAFAADYAACAAAYYDAERERQFNHVINFMEGYNE